MNVGVVRPGKMDAVIQVKISKGKVIQQVAGVIGRKIKMPTIEF